MSSDPRVAVWFVAVENGPYCLWEATSTKPTFRLWTVTALLLHVDPNRPLVWTPLRLPGFWGGTYMSKTNKLETILNLDLEALTLYSEHPNPAP